MEKTDKEIFAFTVNGDEIKTEHEKLIAADILRLAKDAGAIPANPDNYQLETVEGNNKFKQEDWVDLREFKEFITVPTGKTDVAKVVQ